MCAVRRPDDVIHRRRMIERAARDLAPGQLDRVREILDRWDENSQKELSALLGEERAKRLMRELNIP